MWGKPKKKLNGAENVFLQNYDPRSRFAEAYRTLRTNVHFAFMEKDFRSIMVSSAMPSEGKSSTVLNLSFTLAQTGKRVLMVDADLRKPSLNRMVNLPESTGMTGLLMELFNTGVITGDLGKLSVRDILHLLSFQKKSGWLYLENQHEKVSLCLVKGEMVDLNWDTRPTSDRLASVLVRNNLLTAQQAELALQSQKNTDQKLAYILINMGLLSQEKLIGPLSIHMLEGLRTALMMNAGTYSFTEMADNDFDHASFDPVDFGQLKKQLTVGNESLPFLQTGINAAILHTEVENLFLLPSGKLPANPLDILSSSRMTFLLDYLKRRFDVLVIDTPPILQASDALLLAPQTDGIVMIVKPGLANREMIQQVVDQVRTTQANLLGIVLNNVDTKREGYYKYYHRYYAKYYGD